MNDKRIRQLDAAWDVYQEWLEAGQPFTFAEFLHFQYKIARRDNTYAGKEAEHEAAHE